MTKRPVLLILSILPFPMWCHGFYMGMSNHSESVMAAGMLFPAAALTLFFVFGFLITAIVNKTLRGVAIECALVLLAAPFVAVGVAWTACTAFGTRHQQPKFEQHVGQL